MSITGRDQTKAGAGLSYLLMFVSIAANFLVIRFITLALGEDEFGVYKAIGDLAGYMAVLDFGIGVTIVRYIAKYRAEGNMDAQQNFLATSLITYTIIAVLVLAVGLTASNFIGMIFKKTFLPADISMAKTMFILLVVNMALSLPFGAFRAVMDGYEQFVLPRVLNIFRSVLRLALVYLLLRAGHNSIMVVVVDTVLNITMQLVIMLYVLFRLKIRFQLKKFDVSLIKELFVFSMFIFMTMVYDMIFWKLDQTLLGVMVSKAAVAVCSYGVFINVNYMRFSTAISEVFLPRVTKMIVDGADGKALTDFMIKVGRVQMLVLGLAVTGFVLFGRLFMQLWVQQLDNTSYLVALIVMLPLTVPLIQNIGISILQAKNLHKFRAMVYLLIAVINIVATVLLIQRFGILGAPIATSIALIIGNVIIINLYYKRKIGIEVGRFFKETLLRNLPGLLLPVSIGYILVSLLLDKSWVSFLIGVIAYSIFYFVINWFTTMNRFEKDLFKSLLKRIGIIRRHNA